LGGETPQFPVEPPTIARLPPSKTYIDKTAPAGLQLRNAQEIEPIATHSAEDAR